MVALDIAGRLISERSLYPIPLSTVVLGSTLSLMGFAAIRFYTRLFARRRRISSSPQDARVLVVGAGSAGAMIIRDIQRTPSLGLAAVAIIDDDPHKVGRSLHGIPIMGPLSELSNAVELERIDQVLLAIPSATSSLVREVAELCEVAEVSLRVLPSVNETVGGRVTARDIRDVQIEDLLGRQQVEIDDQKIATLIEGKRVLITGAGGSIGSEITRQVASFRPRSMALLDHDESHLHEVMTDVPSALPLLADIRDASRMEAVFNEFQPEVVFHAAAHKHVPILESHPQEAFLTNVLGTANVIRAAAGAGAERFVLISTDKAINPASVMGATKRLAEQLLWRDRDPSTAFCAVRFGNVLGSRGSVIPTFFRQVAAGGPVTVTDPTMTRYFMSIQEAVELVLQAASMSHGGEVFTLDMGEPVNILDLARRVIRLSGQVPNKDIEITIVGPRPGEKVTEDIADETDELMPSVHPAIRVSRPVSVLGASSDDLISWMERLAQAGDNPALSKLLKSPETWVDGSDLESQLKR